MTGKKSGHFRVRYSELGVPYTKPRHEKCVSMFTILYLIFFTYCDF